MTAIEDRHALLSRVRSRLTDAEELEVETDDGATIVEFTCAKTGREFALVFPPDSRFRYFVARCPVQPRRAGVVDDDAAVDGLATWLCQSDAEFPAHGLVLGTNPTTAEAAP